MGVIGPYRNDERKQHLFRGTFPSSSRLLILLIRARNEGLSDAIATNLGRQINMLLNILITLTCRLSSLALSES
jgi:hypothetical protein